MQHLDELLEEESFNPLFDKVSNLNEDHCLQVFLSSIKETLELEEWNFLYQLFLEYKNLECKNLKKIDVGNLISKINVSNEHNKQNGKG